MPTSRQLSRISLRTDQVLEVQFSPWPVPLPQLLKLPGFSQWWDELKLARERDIQTFNAMKNNLGRTVDGGTP